MKAFCFRTATTVAPFGDPVGESMINGHALAEAQQAALLTAGFDPVDTPPTDEPYLLYSDRTWFTAEAVRRLRNAGVGRFEADDASWFAWTGSQQRVESKGVYELAIVSGPPEFSGATNVVVPLDLRDMEFDVRHKALGHALEKPIRVGPAMVHQVDHWSHIVRVNQLALINRMEEARTDWESAGLFGRMLRLWRILWSAKSLNGWKIARGLSEFGAEVSVHPTAVVEFSTLGDGCEIGPHAVVRGSVLAAGVKVDSHAVVNASILGTGAQVGRFGHVNLCTLYPGAMVSAGDGFQVSVFGRDSFIAWGSAILDLSFGRSIKVETDGPGTERVESGQHFLGAAVGHRARIGHGVKVGYGVSVPNDALLVDDGEFLQAWGDAPTNEPCVIRGGRAAKRKP